MVTSGFKRSASGPAGMIRRSDEGVISENISFRVILHPCSFVSSLQANRVFAICEVFGDRAATDLPDCQHRISPWTDYSLERNCQGRNSRFLFPPPSRLL